MIRRALEVLLAGIALLLLAPVFLLIACLIKLSSPGSALFRQERVGRDGKPFLLYKFRTMEERAGPPITSAEDPRVFPLGRLLRRAKLDELPQLINILRGEMGFVGPRPELRRFVEMFPREYREILTVPPGLTDPASLAFVDEEELLARSPDPQSEYLRAILPAKLRLSLDYVRRRSLGRDAVILAETALALLARIRGLRPLPPPEAPGEPQDDSALPFVSVIIPCRNERDFIARCVDTIVEGGYPRDRLEVLAVDGMSEDGTRDMLESLRKKHPALRVLDNPGRSAPAALNVGLAHARGDVIARMDAHADYPPDYLLSLVRWLLSSGADNVGGVWATRPRDSSLRARAIAAAMAHPFGAGNARFRIGARAPRWVDTVPFGCYRRGVFDRLGPFDEELVRDQDDEFNLRLTQAGGKILLVPQIICNYYARATFGALARMYYGYGLYKPLLIRKRRALASLRQLAPTLLLLTLILLCLCALLGVHGRAASTSLLILLCVYIAAALHCARRKLLLAPLVAAAFIVIHFAYGSGFLAGILRFWLLGRPRRA